MMMEGMRGEWIYLHHKPQKTKPLPRKPAFPPPIMPWHASCYACHTGVHGVQVNR